MRNNMLMHVIKGVNMMWNYIKNIIVCNSLEMNCN